MSGILIESKSEKGATIIEKVIDASSGDDERWIAFFRETILTEKPYRIVIEHRNFAARRATPSKALSEIVRKNLGKMGAEYGRDYEVRIL